MRELQKEIIELERTKPTIEPEHEVRRSVDFLKDYLQQNPGLKTYVLGISGGQDSTLAGKLARWRLASCEQKLVLRITNLWRFGYHTANKLTSKTH